MEQQIILGIDPGCTVTGFSIVKKVGAKISVIDYGYLSLPSKKHLSVRIGIFYDFFLEKLKKVSRNNTYFSRNSFFIQKCTKFS